MVTCQLNSSIVWKLLPNLCHERFYGLNHERFFNIIKSTSLFDGHMSTETMKNSTTKVKHSWKVPRSKSWQVTLNNVSLTLQWSLANWNRSPYNSIIMVTYKLKLLLYMKVSTNPKFLLVMKNSTTTLTFRWSLVNWVQALMRSTSLFDGHMSTETMKNSMTKVVHSWKVQRSKSWPFTPNNVNLTLQWSLVNWNQSPYNPIVMRAYTNPVVIKNSNNNLVL